MEKVSGDANDSKSKSFVKMGSDKDVDHVDEIDDSRSSESKSLLPPREGVISKSVNRSRRKVQWNDRNGDKLVEVLEFEPSSDESETDSEDEDKDSCICTIM